MQSTSTSSLNPGAPNPELYLRAQPSCTEPAQSCFLSSTLKSSTWCTRNKLREHLMGSTGRKKVDFLLKMALLARIVLLMIFYNILLPYWRWFYIMPFSALSSFCAHPQSALSPKRTGDYISDSYSCQTWIWWKYIASFFFWWCGVWVIWTVFNVRIILLHLRSTALMMTVSYRGCCGNCL